ncbi:MAG TPA: hypothetical protein VGG27_01540 [Magnetospirillaceae bacterium]|jgi:hypothetical protein
MPQNRNQRRAAVKKGRGNQAPRPAAAQAAPNSPPPLTVPEGPPGPLLRFFAYFLLSRWVINRVRHPDIERTLASMAMQVGRPEIADSIMKRQQMRAQRKS